MPLPRINSIVPGSFLERTFNLAEISMVERLDESPTFERGRRAGLRAFLLAPIVSGDGRVDTALAIHFSRERSFDQVDIVLLRSIAMHVGLALDNAGLYEKERRARRRAEMLEQSLRQLRGVRRPAEILRQIADSIVREFGACGSAWSLQDSRFWCEAAAARKEALMPSYALGTSVEIRPRHLDLLREKEVILTRDDPELWKDLASKEAMIVPLLVDERLWGFLSARIDLQPGETDVDRANFLRTLSAHTALVLSNAHAFEEQRRAAHERSLLSEAARLILTFNRPEPLAAAMTRLALALAGAERAELYVPRDGNLRRIGCATELGDCDDLEIASLEDPVLGPTFATSETRIEEDAHRIVLALPSMDHVAGVLVAQRDPEGSPRFEDGEVRLLESFCALLGLGLRNCELYEAESAANQALAQSNEFKDDLMAMFTHDFRGPLTVISGYAELMGETSSPDIGTAVDVIDAQAKRLLALCEDALELAHSQAVGYRLQRATHDLVALLRETVEGLGAGAARVRLEVPDKPVQASVDPVRLRDAAQNLIGNALKYSEGEVEVRVEPGLGAARIVVADRGIGIPSGERDRIFARFGRGSNARRLGVAGTGIGLYTARQIVEGHGGHVEVDSVENQGSVFTLTLPTLVGFESPPRPDSASATATA
ncbi:MAG: hypothetical protein JO101_11685 [Candidatus Eremiobacteraeota bacterium]|nr:hypothetical protein [Candidatus Eremiobacteraeota bacterium]